MKLYLDDVTKQEAKNYADNEAEYGGFPVGSSKWKEAYKEFVSHALSAMTVGRNPRGARYKIFTSVYPEIFGPGSLSEKWAKNYYTQEGTRGVDRKIIEGRILSSVMNLSKLLENSVLELRNTTIGSAQGKISNKDMSELQFPNKEDFATDQEYRAEIIDVLHNWLCRDIITAAILHGLETYFTLTQNDVQKILAEIKIDADKDKIPEVIRKARAELLSKLKTLAKDNSGEQKYIKLILG